METYTLSDFVCNQKPCYFSLEINRLLLLLLCKERRSPSNLKAMAPSFLPFFDPSKIEHTTAFLLRSMARTMLGTVYYCTCARYSSLCTLTLNMSCLYCTVQLPGATLASGGRFRE